MRALCHCAYQAGTLLVGVGDPDWKLYVAAFDLSKREIVRTDRETAEREGMVIYTDPYLGNTANMILQNEPYRPGPGPAATYQCPLCGTNSLKFHRVGFWD